MSTIEKYNEIFCQLFSLEAGFDGEEVKMNSTKDWDSVGQMALITAIEDAFGIMMETEDMLEFVSYTRGMEILRKYDISF